MEWRGIICTLFFILSIGESSSRFQMIWLPNLGAGVDVAGTYFTWPILSASVFVTVAILISMYLIFEHLASYNQPEEQKFLIGLILMVPVYALESFLSLVNSEAAFNCEVIRDCYEAFALYCFERYMIACLDGEERTIEFMEQQTVITQTTPLLEGTCSYKVVEHPFPMNCFLKDWNLGPQFYHAVKIGIVQYMILKMICALLAMLLEAFGVYGEGKFQWNYGYPYLAVVLNFSQTWALYCLVQFYNVIKDKLAPIKPLAKFLTFKSIVFLTWWQGIIVAFLFSMGLFKGSLAKELKTRIQDYIICIEMGVAAVVHLYVFPAAPYKRGERCVRNVAVMSDYASIDTPPDPEEVKDSERTTRVRYGRHDDEWEKRLNFPQSVRDVVVGSGEIIADDMRFTVSHVVEPVERGIAKINRTFHQISENVKRFEQKKRRSKDDSYVISEIMVTFPVIGDQDNAAFVAWTTTPWTLPSNLALCVNAKFVYVKVRNKHNGKVYVVAESRLSALPADKPKASADTKKANPKAKGGAKPDSAADSYEVLEKFDGASLVGKKYEPLFEYFSDFSSEAFRVVADSYVTDDSGTGIVHCAPAFGEDDYRVCLENNIIKKGENLVVAVDDDGLFTERITHFSGRYVKDADKDIIEAVKAKGRLVKTGSFVHSYPFCWRSDTPLIYRAVPSWFVRVELLKEQLLENNKQTHWVPDYVKDKRFHNWLENARDWAVSRSRFWGTPLPIWISDDGEEIVVMDSVEKLEKLSGVKVYDLHRHHIDHITIPSSRGPEFGVLHRVEDVFDCWFESGSMPYAYIHYPFENKELFEKNFPGHFVAEGLDQTRGWFYTLMVLSTALFGKPAFRNLICNGLVLAEDGKKMSKKLRNYPPPLEVIDEYGADAVRLYIINSPVVRAEPLRFKKEGVLGVVKDVFLPWYNAYRFLVQNAKRLEIEGSGPFVPTDLATLRSSNVLDQWIHSATQSLVHFVRQEMDGYRLYTVVPYLLKFLDNLTNIYVRFNRKRLKGRTGEDDCHIALSTLYNVLLTSCKVMTPFTPFFTETLYQNLRKACEGSEESIHYCSFPEAEGTRDERIEQSVTRMMTIIDLARNIRERHKLPLKTPLKEITVVHPDAEFLDDITGKLREYVLEELNVRSLVPCNDTLKYASLKAEPDFSALGKRLGKSMGLVAKEVKAMSQQDILRFEEAEKVTIAGHTLELTDIKIVRVFKRPDGLKETEIDANGDGDVLVILDLRADDSLYEAGVAREIVNRIQKLRKKSGLEPTDFVEVYIESLDKDVSALQQVMNSQEQYIKDTIGSSLLLSTLMPSHAVILSEESFQNVSKLSFKISLARPALKFNEEAIIALYSGDVKFASGLQAYLLSRDHSNLKSEFQEGNGKITVSCIEKLPVVTVVLGDHLHLTVGDYLLSTANS